MDTITLTGTFPTAGVLELALEKGYTLKIRESQLDKNNMPVQTEIDNPLTPAAFISNWYKDYIANDITQFQIKKMRIQSEETLNNAEQAVKKSIGEALTFEVTQE